MSANLQLLPRKCFVITLANGTICEGQFGTWSLAQFGLKKNMSLAKLIEYMDDIKTMDIISFVVCAIEYKERKNKQQPVINELILSEWIDDYYEVSGEGGVLMKLWAHANDTPNMKFPEEEKKTVSSISPILSDNIVEPVAQ